MGAQPSEEPETLVWTKGGDLQELLEAGCAHQGTSARAQPSQASQEWS